MMHASNVTNPGNGQAILIIIIIMKQIVKLGDIDSIDSIHLPQMICEMRIKTLYTTVLEYLLTRCGHYAPITIIKYTFFAVSPKTLCCSHELLFIAMTWS